MSQIQDARAFAFRLYDLVCDYLNGYYDDTDVMAISWCDGDLVVEANDPANLMLNDTTEFYAFKDLLRYDDLGFLEPDSDKLDVIANGWVFLE